MLVVAERWLTKTLKIMRHGGKDGVVGEPLHLLKFSKYFKTAAHVPLHCAHVQRGSNIRFD